VLKRDGSTEGCLSYSSPQLFAIFLQDSVCLSTSREVAGSIRDEIIGFISLPNASGSTVALGSTQPLTEMSTRDLPGGKYNPIQGSQRCCVSLHIVGPDLDKPVITTDGKTASDAIT
jgi:hypothetical protein